MALEGVFKQLNWPNREIILDRERMLHLRFTDNTLAESDTDFKSMITELQEKSINIHKLEHVKEYT